MFLRGDKTYDLRRQREKRRKTTHDFRATASEDAPFYLVGSSRMERNILEYWRQSSSKARPEFKGIDLRRKVYSETAVLCCGNVSDALG